MQPRVDRIDIPLAPATGAHEGRSRDACLRDRFVAVPSFDPQRTRAAEPRHRNDLARGAAALEQHEGVREISERTRGVAEGEPRLADVRERPTESWMVHADVRLAQGVRALERREGLGVLTELGQRACLRDECLERARVGRAALAGDLLECDPGDRERLGGCAPVQVCDRDVDPRRAGRVLLALESGDDPSRPSTSPTSCTATTFG